MLRINKPSPEAQRAADELFDRADAHQIANAPFLAGAAADADPVGPLGLNEDQDALFRVIARALRQRLHQSAQDLKDNPAKGKNWRKEVEAAVLMSEGILELAAAVLDDPDIIENPDTL